MTRKLCKAQNRDAEPCRNRAIPGSKYCRHHQDPIAWLTTAIGISIAVLILMYQERAPNLMVEVRRFDQPALMECWITNRGRGEARDVSVAFGSFLLEGVIAVAPPEVGITVHRAIHPPDPQANPALAMLLTAFSVRIPRIAARDGFLFSVQTTNRDNLRAAAQVRFLRPMETNAMRQFYAAVTKKYAGYSNLWNINEAVDSRILDQNFFHPISLSYEAGRFPISGTPEEVLLARAAQAEFYAKHKAEFVDVFTNKQSFLAPVVRIVTGNDQNTISIHSPYVNTYSLYLGDHIPTKGEKITLPLIFPKSYEWEGTNVGGP